MAVSQSHDDTGAATPRAGMNPNLKIFIAIFLFIGGLVGLVLAVLNASEKPAATTHAIIFGAVGLVLLVGGFGMIRRRRY